MIKISLFQTLFRESADIMSTLISSAIPRDSGLRQDKSDSYKASFAQWDLARARLRVFHANQSGTGFQTAPKPAGARMLCYLFVRRDSSCTAIPHVK
jgi:hypothetical protein